MEFYIRRRIQTRYRAEIPLSADRGAYSSHNRAFRREKAYSRKRSLYDHYEEMRTSRLQLCGCARKELLLRYMCRCEENTRSDLPMPPRGMRWEIAQRLAVYIPQA